MEALKPVREFIHGNPNLKKYGEMIEEKTKIPIEIVAVTLLVVPLFMVYAGFFRHTVTDLIGYGYPFYASVLSLEKKATYGGPNGSWLVYWVVYSLFDTLEDVFDALLFFLPYYHPLKMIFFVWLMAPQTAGAKIIYDKALLPAFKQVEEVVDSMGR